MIDIEDLPATLTMGDLSEALKKAEQSGYERGVRDAANAISHWVFTADMGDDTRAAIGMNRQDHRAILALLPKETKR